MNALEATVSVTPQKKKRKKNIKAAHTHLAGAHPMETVVSISVPADADADPCAQYAMVTGIISVLVYFLSQGTSST